MGARVPPGDADFYRRFFKAPDPLWYFPLRGKVPVGSPRGIALSADSAVAGATVQPAALHICPDNATMPHIACGDTRHCCLRLRTQDGGRWPGIYPHRKSKTPPIILAITDGVP